MVPKTLLVTSSYHHMSFKSYSTSSSIGNIIFIYIYRHLLPAYVRVPETPSYYVFTLKTTAAMFAETSYNF